MAFKHHLEAKFADLVSPQDDLRHRPEPGGRMRDSLFWQVSLPDEALCLQIYLFCTEAGSAGYNVCLWGAALARPLTFFHLEEIGVEPDFSDVRLGGLHVVQDVASGTAHVRFAQEGLAIDYRFAPLHAAFSYHANADGLPSWFALNRIEQSGVLSGFVEAGGRRVALEGRIGHRDHSWGLRDWGMPQHWKWLAAYAPEGETLVNAWIWFAGGERGVAGYVARQGVVRPIRAIAEKTLYDAEMIQQSLEMRIDDGSETPLNLRLESFATLRFPSTKRNPAVITEAGCRAWLNGVSGAGQYETQWQADYLTYLQSRRAQG